MPTVWKVACQENLYPGMWQRWFKNQCVAIGWAAAWGYKLRGPTEGGKGWSAARNGLTKMKPGDYVIVALRGRRIGRLGQITSTAIEDDQWSPLVPRGPKLPDGEMGRRVLVRWDLTIGPNNHDLVVQLPAGTTFSNGELRPTISKINSLTIEKIKSVMNDPSNWVSLLGNFKYEKMLSDFIANYPNRLEDGLLPHPNSKIRERVFKDKTRLDVLLIDRENKPVIVECKQYAPTLKDINQLRQYMNLLNVETNQESRGFLVHGGAAKLTDEIAKEVSREPRVEVVSYMLDVVFRPLSRQ